MLLSSLHEDCYITISAHALERFQQRFNMNPQQARRIANKALCWAHTLEDFSGDEKRFLMLRARRLYIPLVLGRMLLLLSPDASVIITVYRLPDWFGCSVREAIYPRRVSDGQYGRHHGYYNKESRQEKYLRTTRKSHKEYNSYSRNSNHSLDYYGLWSM